MNRRSFIKRSSFAVGLIAASPGFCNEIRVEKFCPEATIVFEMAEESGHPFPMQEKLKYNQWIEEAKENGVWDQLDYFFMFDEPDNRNSLTILKWP